MLLFQGAAPEREIITRRVAREQVRHGRRDSRRQGPRCFLR